MRARIDVREYRSDRMQGRIWRRLRVTLAARVALALSGVALASCTMPGGVGDRGVHIDYINFVRFNGIEYVTPLTLVGRAPTDADRGPLFATVRAKLDGQVSDPNYQPRDGDAAFLEPGTPVYRVTGYAPTFRLVATFAGRLVFYEANTNAQARTGADLLDVANKVTSIGVNDEQMGTRELGSIQDRAQVDSLVALLLSAPVDLQGRETSAAQYFIVLHLVDGTAVVRNYWPASGRLVPGIMLPPAFRVAVEQAVQPHA